MFKELIKTIIVSLMTLSLISVAYAWTEPISTPPSGNVSTPINAGSTYQYKNGNFGLSSSSASTALDIRGPLSGQWTASGINLGATDTGETNYWHLGYRGSLSTNEYKNLAAWFYNGSSWINPLSLTPNGKVGIGITNPGAAYKLDVAGAINTTGGLYVSGTRKDTVWDGKQDAIAGGASTITTSNLTASRALVSDASGKVAVSGTTSTELGYVSGVTSAVQTQLNAKAPTASPTFTGTVSGITATMVGLGNVTNESKSTMFASPTFTGNINFPGSGIWNSSGNVGIGTATPGTNHLSIKGTTGFSDGINAEGGTVGIRGYASNYGVIGSYTSGTGYNGVLGQSFNSPWVSVQGAGVVGLGSSYGVYGYGANGGYDLFAGNSSGKSYFAGRVGIGTVPSYKFEVSGGTSYFNSSNPLWNAISTNGGAYIGGTIRGATYGFGGMYVHNFEGNNACVYQNPFTGFCSCPSGFTAAQITLWTWNEHNTNTFYCYK